MMESTVNGKPNEKENSLHLDERFDILGIIGEGANSIVYKAEHKALDQLVAIKILKRDIHDNPSAQERFRREARLAVKLSHPNIVKLFGFGTNTNNENFLVMEYCQGESLDKQLQQRKMSLEEVRIFGLQLADALSHAHKFGIVHRDIKPANIMCTAGDDEQTDFKLLDFGLAKEITTDDTTDSARITRTAFIVGTPHYMSPEQCTSGMIDARSDIYSLGCVLYECVTGRKPFTGDSSLVLMDMHLNSKIDFAPGVLVSPDLKQAILRCLEKSPENRFQNANDLYLALKSADLGVKAAPAKLRIPQMAFTIFSVLSLLAVCALFSQSIMQRKADASSIVLHKRHSKSLVGQKSSHLNSLSADELVERADTAWSQNKDESIRLYKLAEQSALRENRPGTAAMCKYEIGLKYMSTSEPEKSIKYFSTAIQDLSKLKMTGRLSTLYVRLAEAYDRNDEPKKVVECYKIAEKYALENSQAKAFLDEKIGLANFYFSHDKYKESLDAYHQAWNGFEESLKKDKDRARYAFMFLPMIHAELRLKQFGAIPQQTEFIKSRIPQLSPNDFNPAPLLFAANTALENEQFDTAKNLASIVIEYDQAREALSTSIAKEIIRAANSKEKKIQGLNFNKTFESELNKIWRERKAIILPNPTIGELLKSTK